MTRTPDEVKKGLACCKNGIPYRSTCAKGCPYKCGCSPSKVCASVMMNDALALIQQLQNDNAEKDGRILQLKAERDAACLKNRCVESVHMLCEDGSVQRDPIAGAQRLRGV